jgi:stage IV sporulation protein FB
MTLIHEMGHVIMAIIFKLKVNKIKLLAIGFTAEIDGLDDISSFKDFMITIAGPLTYFITLYLLNIALKHDLISLNAYNQALIVNKYDLFFNLLPIIPLDGGRILKLIMDNFFVSKKASLVASVISALFTILFIIYTYNTSPQYLVYVFLIISNVLFALQINKKWKRFLMNRLIHNNNYKDKLHAKNDLYRNRNNYILKNKKIINEKEAIMYIMNENMLK